MADYKDTLNLPQTDFPMRADLAKREPERLKFWETINIYAQQRHQRQGKPMFVLHDGPPYANGRIHIGHALNKILKDIIVKAKHLDNRELDTPYIPGWDCHGLPIELNVEKTLGKAGEKISLLEFRKACRNYAKSQVAIQREEFKRLGVIGDWEHPYLTMDPLFEANIIRALAKIAKNGFLVPGFKPVHWCVDCGSALAEAEVEYLPKNSSAIDVDFEVINKEEFLKKISSHLKRLINFSDEVPIIIPIWTTTPWTLPANEAVALHPGDDDPQKIYELFEIVNADGKKERLLLASQLAMDALDRYGVEKIVQLSKSGIKGRLLEDILLQHPFYDHQVRVVLSEHVTMDSGTGAVHIAPAHGQEDYIVGQRYQLPVMNPVDRKGCFLTDTLFFGDEPVFKANEHIIKKLRDNRKLRAEKRIEHNYPHCWRHKTPLIFLATPQWFITLHKEEDTHNEIYFAAEVAIEKVRWIPGWGKENISNMILNRPDWCISRQRSWGTPMTLLVHKQTGQLHPDIVAIMEKIATRVETEGMEAWFASTTQDWLGDDAKEYEKVTDVLDVWFDSGVAHFCVPKQHPELTFPADVYLEGSDQYRGWFQSSLLTAVAMKIKANEANSLSYAQAPYKTVITHGFTVDEKGRKMSKSLGNVIAPEKVINSLGADILRLWAASTDYRGEISISDEILTRISEVYRRIRNTLRYLLSSLFDFDPSQHLVSFDKMVALDRWAVDRAYQLQQEIRQAYDEFQFHQVSQKIHHFCTFDMGGFYLDIIKDRQYTTAKNSHARRSAQTAVYYILEAITRWLAPILSFTAEEVWQFIPWKQQDSIFLTTWYEDLPQFNSKELSERQRWQDILQIREQVNRELEKTRNAGKIGAALAAEVIIYGNEKWRQLLDEIAQYDELRFIFITSYAKVLSADKRPTDAIATDLDGLWIKVSPANYPKCIRCWHRREDVGHNKTHPEICARCVVNITDTAGENRLFA